MSKWFSLAFLLVGSSLSAAESLWIEAEHLDGVRGSCWPMGRPEMQKTDGHWALSGPGWAAEWNMGGESGFLSIATAADDDRAAATKNVEIPAAGTFQLWVRYGDWRERTERFQVQIEQAGAAPWSGTFGERPLVDEDNEMKLYWGWVFVWDHRAVPLAKGPAKITLRSTTKETQPRQVDLLVLTSDAGYQPRIKDRPHRYSWDVLESYRGSGLAELEGLARNPSPPELPPAWKLRTFRNKGFLYLWNVSHTKPEETWLGDKPDRVPVPYNIIDAETRAEFEKTYASRGDVPIFSDPRVVPTFHGVGAGIFATDAKTGEVLDAGKRFARWLDAHPDRCWAMMMNYHPGVPIGEQGQQLFARYRDRYVGSIAGESLGYFYPQAEEMRQATVNAKTRRQLVEAFTPLTLRSNAEKYRAVFGKDLDQNPYQDVIACLSVGNIAFTPLTYLWGARTAGYESSAMTSSLLAMRWAFLRGAARQNEGLTATYRSCNFGDSATIFSNGGSYHAPQNIIENYYSVYSGAGMTWYKMDIWYQYMAGSSMFYHEQGFDEFWRPGGTGTGVRPVQLSPKGKLVDRFLRLTAAQPDRGDPYTPVAFLVDYAHGWEPAPFWPNSFKNWHEHQDRFRYGDHEQMLQEYFWTAWHPIGPESEKPITGLNEVHVPGVFGDIFDVIFAYPDTKRWGIIDSYPVVIVAGEIELTAAEGQRLAQYVASGGTLLVADGHLSGPGLAALNLPPAGEPVEAYGYCWLEDSTVQPSQLFRLKPIDAKGGRELARTPDGKCFGASFDRGLGRLIYLSVPHGLGVDRQAVPVVARLIAHLTRGLMPVEVTGDVQWLVNRAANGWLVTLLNPAGQLKPQQGIHPTDFRENRMVKITSRSALRAARDRLLPDETLRVEQNSVRCEVQAGGVRIVELQ